MLIHLKNKDKHKVKKQTRKKYLQYVLQERVLSYQNRNNLQINKKMNDPARNGERI